MMEKILIVIIGAFINLNCNSSVEKNTHKEVNMQPETTAEQLVIKEKICDLALMVDEKLATIISKPKETIDFTNDNCALEVMNSLSNKAISTGDIKYLMALESICNISDGYVGEYLMDLMVEQYYNNLTNLISFLTQERCLKQEVIYGLSMDVSVKGNKAKLKLQDHAKKTEVSEDLKSTLNDVVSKVDPTIFD